MCPYRRHAATITTLTPHALPTSASRCHQAVARSVSKVAAIIALATGMTVAGAAGGSIADAEAAVAPVASDETTAGVVPVPGTVPQAEYERLRQQAERQKRRSGQLARRLSAERRRARKLTRQLRSARRSVRTARRAQGDPVIRRAAMWARLAECETRGRWRLASGNGFHGGLQFHPRTWRAYGGGAFAPYAHLATPIEQAAVAEQVLDRQGRGAWPHCGSVAGLG